MNSRYFLILSRLFFFLGIIIGLGLVIVAIWNHTEATSYYYSGVTYAPFHSLRCPLIIAPAEKGTITAVFDNSSNQEDIYYYRVQVSQDISSARTFEDKITVPPRQTKSAQWSVDIKDVDLRFFILVKITILPNAFHPPQEAACGILIANILGFNGAQASAIILILSFLGIAAGLGLWQQTETKANQDLSRLAQALVCVILFALLATAMGWWAIASVFSVIALLLLLIPLRFVLT